MLRLLGFQRPGLVQVHIRAGNSRFVASHPFALALKHVMLLLLVSRHVCWLLIQENCLRVQNGKLVAGSVSGSVGHAFSSPIYLIASRC
jgi:hypothetical protein